MSRNCIRNAALPPPLALSQTLALTLSRPLPLPLSLSLPPSLFLFPFTVANVLRATLTNLIDDFHCQSSSMSLSLSSLAKGVIVVVAQYPRLPLPPSPLLYSLPTASRINCNCNESFNWPSAQQLLCRSSAMLPLPHGPPKTNKDSYINLQLADARFPIRNSRLAFRLPDKCNKSPSAQTHWLGAASAPAPAQVQLEASGLCGLLQSCVNLVACED